LEENHVGLLVGPASVRLVELGEHAGLNRYIDMSGTYAVFNYRRDGSISGATIPTMKMQVDLRKSPPSCMIKANGGFSVIITHCLTSNEIEITTCPISPALVTEMVWLWLVLKPNNSFQI
jgi:hypothetical protein